MDVLPSGGIGHACYVQVVVVVLWWHQPCALCPSHRGCLRQDGVDGLPSLLLSHGGIGHPRHIVTVMAWPCIPVMHVLFHLSWSSSLFWRRRAAIVMVVVVVIDGCGQLW